MRIPNAKTSEEGSTQQEPQQESDFSKALSGLDSYTRRGKHIAYGMINQMDDAIEAASGAITRIIAELGEDPNVDAHVRDSLTKQLCDATFLSRVKALGKPIVLLFKPDTGPFTFVVASALILIAVTGEKKAIEGTLWETLVLICA
ncbi:MAG: hypothetical protein Q4A07_02050 [Coriobacteriales bacterium]|nr:hypothetical protein [Coriobacteriales bacterium]